MWKLISNPISLYASHFILCYKMLTYFTWDLHYDHARQTLLHFIAEGLHLSSALSTFDDGYYFHTSTIIPLFKKRWDPPSRAISWISALFPQTLTEDPPQTWYFAEVPHFQLPSTLDDLRISFSQNFDFMPHEQSINIDSTHLIFHLRWISTDFVAELLGASCTVTAESRQRTLNIKDL